MAAGGRLVIFDVDGTLVDSQASILAAMERAFTDTGRAPPPRAAVLGIVGLSLPEAMAVLAPDTGEAERMRLVALYRTAFGALRRQTGAEAAAPLYPGAAATVTRLTQAGFLLAVATGKARRGLSHFLASHGFARHFVATQTADDAPSKPHPGMVLNCLAATGVAPGDAVMVGDTAFDMAMARAAGCRAIGVAWGYHGRERILAAGAETIVESFDELDALLGQPPVPA